jgi:transposase
MTIVEERTAITGGVDTHSEVHVAAALDPLGGLLGTWEFPATAAGYASLLGWLGKFGDVALVGVEGTGSYGAGLARYLAGHGVRVVEVDRADRQDRATASPTRWTRSAPPVPPCPGGQQGCPRAATGRWRRSGR